MVKNRKARTAEKKGRKRKENSRAGKKAEI